MEREKRLKKIQKIGYGLGDIGSNFSWTFISSFIMLYCTNIIKIDPAIIGSLFMLAKIFDGISDIIMGRIIDKTNSKMGKAKIWYLISIFPTVIFTYLLFNVGDDFSQNEKYAYVFLIYSLLGTVFYTMNNISYSAMTALCTKNKEDRVEMGSFRYFFAMIAIVFINSYSLNLIAYFGKGQKAWSKLALIYSIIALIFLLIPVFSVKELKDEEIKSDFKVFQSLKILLKNKYFILIFFLHIFTYLSIALSSTMMAYFAKYSLKNTDRLITINIFTYLPIICALPFIPKITKRLSMRDAGILGHSIGLIGGFILIISLVRKSFILFLLGIFLKSLGTAPQTGVLNAIIAEIDDYSFKKIEKKLTGTIYSLTTFSIKLGSGLGVFISGIFLKIGRFDGQILDQGQKALNFINYSYILSHALLPLISLFIFYFLDLEKFNEKY